MRIGFTGSRKGMTPAQTQKLREVLNKYAYNIGEFHHGDCIGADSQAHKIALSMGWNIVLHPPDNDKQRAFCNDGVHFAHSPRPYLERNHNVVDQTEVLIAAPSGPEELRSGTWATIRYAKKINRLVIIL